MAGIPGLRVFGPELSTFLDLESQRLWLFGLIFSVISSCIKVGKLLRVESGLSAVGGNVQAAGRVRSNSRNNFAEHGHQPRVTSSYILVVLESFKDSGARKLIMRMSADLLDMIIPLSGIRWYEARPETIGSIMLLTTLMTASEEWKKCQARLVAH